MTATVRPVTAADVYAAAWARMGVPFKAMLSSISAYKGRVIGLDSYLCRHSFWDIENRCYLNDIGALSENRGTGGGAKLIEAVVSHAKGRNSAAVYWLTNNGNVKARRLYDYVATLTPFVKYQV